LPLSLSGRECHPMRPFLAYAQPVLTTRKSKLMILVVQHRRYGKVHITTELCSWPGHGSCDLVCKHGPPSAVSASPGAIKSDPKEEATPTSGNSEPSTLTNTCRQC
jgi:hypothetical protein